MKLPHAHVALYVSGLTGSNAYRYFTVTQTSYLTAKRLHQEFVKASPDVGNPDQIYEELLSAAQNAVIYSGMCIEATLYDLALALYGKAFADHFDRVDPLAKFFILARMIDRCDPKIGGVTYQSLKTVVSERNKLVHSKSTEYVGLEDFGPLIDRTTRENQRFGSAIPLSYRALVLLSMYFDGNIFEELRILPSFKHPEYWQDLVPTPLHEDVAWCRSARQRERKV